MLASTLSCRIEDRRKRLFDNPDWNGIDFVEVLPGQTALCVHFFGPVPENVRTTNVRIEGGRRIRGIRALKVVPEYADDEELDDCLHITLDKFGDFSTYRLCLIERIAATGDLVEESGEEKRPRAGGAVGLYEDSVLLAANFEIVAGAADVKPGDAAAYRLALVRGQTTSRNGDAANSIDLGPLRALNGRQTFRIPADVKLEQFRGVVVRSKTFGVIGYAPLVTIEQKLEDVGTSLLLPPTIPLAGLDPRYSCAEFSFKVECPSDLDCKTVPSCPPEAVPAPDINYLARDYASFRQLILDRLALITPTWRERHVPDLGITLVELLAYVGDYLSYYQDAVATEAYLETARKRISVRRHARLVDYKMHEGNNARAFVTVWVSDDVELDAGKFYFATGFSRIKASKGGVVRAKDLAAQPRGLYEVFEPLTENSDHTFLFRAAHSEIHFYTWGDRECCLPKGATQATLLDEAIIASSDVATDSTAADDHSSPPSERPPRVLDLRKDDILIFEEVIGPTTGNTADADPARRHAIRISKDPVAAEDGLLNRNVLEIEWDLEDALPFALCLSARLPSPDCHWVGCVSVARGNVVLVDHGCTSGATIGPVGQTAVTEDCACEGSILDMTFVPEQFTAAIQDAPLTFAEDYAASASAARLMQQDPRAAKPCIRLQEIIGTPPAAKGPEWTSSYDLLESDSDSRQFVAEIDEDGAAHLRFGDALLGARPTAGTLFAATYRVGNGPSGNVGNETIACLVLRDATLSGVSVKPRNPLAARGGTASEPIALVKLLAPTAFRTRRERAITAQDYAELAERNAAVQQAAGELSWMGSWYEARVSVDPAHSEEADAGLLNDIRHYLYRYRRMGHDLATAPARFVPVDLAIEVCVQQHYTRGEITARLIDVFSNRQLVDGTQGFFHPDRLTFGQGIYLSQILAAAATLDGVETARVSRLTRRDGLGGDALQSGVLEFGPFEVAQSDSDPNFPERGKLTLKVRGGR
ncbi:MAG: hypothetical protein QOF22_1431 [Bradyrhizobium sp.]|nr:hypothetical protein [Bradyrhizobium sp.]